MLYNTKEKENKNYDCCIRCVALPNCIVSFCRVQLMMMYRKHKMVIFTDWTRVFSRFPSFFLLSLHFTRITLFPAIFLDYFLFLLKRILFYFVFDFSSCSKHEHLEQLFIVLLLTLWQCVHIHIHIGLTVRLSLLSLAIYSVNLMPFLTLCDSNTYTHTHSQLV